MGQRGLEQQLTHQLLFWPGARAFLLGLSPEIAARPRSPIGGFGMSAAEYACDGTGGGAAKRPSSREGGTSAKEASSLCSLLTTRCWECWSAATNSGTDSRPFLSGLQCLKHARISESSNGTRASWHVRVMSFGRSRSVP